ncbi:MAG TPA: TRAP transporter substrate-binding protein DctP [Alphaproteobacteria bacterium]
MKWITRSATVTSVACVFVALGGPVSAETVKLIVVGAPPPVVTPVKVTKEFFVPEVSKRLAATGKDFKIEWTEAYSQTLAKFPEVFETVEEGIAHVGVILRNFEESKLPLEAYASAIPFGLTEMRPMIAADARVRAKVPEMNAAFEQNGQVYLAGAISENMHLFTTFPVKTVDDLKGKKIGASGALANYLRGTGAVNVTASMAQSYVDIKNGVYDGYVIGFGLAMPYKTYEAAPHVVRTYFGVTPTPCLTVNAETWKKLPDYVQKIMLDVAQEWAVENVKLDEQRVAAAAKAMEAKGVSIVDMPDSERARWAKMMPNIAKEWAADLDKRGLPGSKVLAAYMEEVRAAGKVIRDWEKE